jgi:cardiolipin synthase
MAAKLASRMSPGHPPNAAKEAAHRIYIEPAQRREAMLSIIGGAKQRLILSLFRCNDYGVLDALAAALERGVKVEAILTKRAKGGKKPLKKLWEALEEMGAVVHWYADPVVKYHAKYVVADERIALIATLNPTKKCFTRTLDFVYTFEEPSLVRSISTLFALDAAGERVLSRHRLSERLIVGPEGSRERMRHLLESARSRIRILDHKLSDPDLVALLRERRDEGIEIAVIGRQSVGALKAHGKLLIIDESRVVLGSMAMSALSLDFRREVSVLVDDHDVVHELNGFFDDLSARVGESVVNLPGDRRA